MSKFTISKEMEGHYSMEGDLVFLTINNEAIKKIEFLSLEKEVSFNLEKIKLVDSAGLALILECIKYSMKNNTKLLFRNVPEQLLILANLGGFDMRPYLS